MIVRQKPPVAWFRPRATNMGPGQVLRDTGIGAATVRCSAFGGAGRCQRHVLATSCSACREKFFRTGQANIQRLPPKCDKAEFGIDCDNLKHADFAHSLRDGTKTKISGGAAIARVFGQSQTLIKDSARWVSAAGPRLD